MMRFPQPLPLADGCVAAVGNFDGVHAGHAALLAVARAEAAQRGLPLVVLTFDPHPKQVLRPDLPHRVLTPLPVRAERLAAHGVQGVAVLPFDGVVAGWAPADFHARVLVGWLAAQAVVVGENFRYGHRAEGSVATLQADSRFAVRAVPLVVDGGGVVSSTRLRRGG